MRSFRVFTRRNKPKMALSLKELASLLRCFGPFLPHFVVTIVALTTSKLLRFVFACCKFRQPAGIP